MDAVSEVDDDEMHTCKNDHFKQIKDVSSSSSESEPNSNQMLDLLSLIEPDESDMFCRGILKQ